MIAINKMIAVRKKVTYAIKKKRKISLIQVQKT